MGLDIYLYKCAMEGDSSRASFKSKGFNNALDAGKNQLQKKLRRSIKRVISALKKEKENGNDITELYKKKMRVLFKYFSYPEFYLSSFGVNAEWNGNKYEYTIEPNDNIFDEKVVNKVIEDTGAKYIAYWRKVNFLYAYFNDLDLIDHDFECAWVDKDNIEDLIERCNAVLDDHSKAEDELPTQSGFFFGSTAYDEWYIHDVRDAKKQLTKVLKGLKDDEQCLIYFSW